MIAGSKERRYGKMLRVVIEKASDSHSGEVKEFNNADELLQYMHNTYHKWIVNFPDPERWWEPWWDKLNVDLKLIIYDDYVEW